MVCAIGGEKGIPLRLFLEMQEYKADQGQGSASHTYQGVCGIKVFKDKGGDRKQRQDQAKLEKLSPKEQVGGLHDKGVISGWSRG
jgi:hypothetical protein